MAYPWDQSHDTLAYIVGDWDGMAWQNNATNISTMLGYDAWFLGDDHAAIGNALDALYYVYSAFLQLMSSWPGEHDPPDYTLLYYLDHFCDTNMENMIRGKFEAEYTEISDWVGLEWSFQQILWDQPFFPDKYTEIINRVRT